MSEPIHYTPEELESHLRWKIDHKQFVMQELDKLVASPTVRGKKVYDVVKDQVDLDNWDLICASVEILAFLAPSFKQGEEEIKALIKQVYSAHYFYVFNDILPINVLQAKFAESGTKPDISPPTSR